tara:strand:+ start:670 stop:825 length:156 start_codon:yes stop_codon:yes gene_type:complete
MLEMVASLSRWLMKFSHMLGNLLPLSGPFFHQGRNTEDVTTLPVTRHFGFD